MDSPRQSPPIFVVGVPRSGTTLLSAMLGAHPRLVCGPETHFFHFLPDDAERLCRPEDWPEAAIDYLYSIRHVGESIPGNYGLARRELTEALGRREPSIPSILSGMVDLYAGRHGKPRWVEKTPDHLPYAALIRRHYPDSPIIRIIRDPRANAASLMAVPWGASDVFDALHRWWKNYDDRSAHFFEVDPLCHTVRYEALVSDPEPVLRTICQVIGEPFHPAMLDTSGSALLVNAANELCKDKVAQGLDSSRVDAWRETFSDAELRLVESYIGDRLRAYGYPPAGPPCPDYVEVHGRHLLGLYPDVVGDLAARGGRFWRRPDERPSLSVFLGDPNAWLGGPRADRYSRTIRLACTILRHRLAGVPIAWIGAPDRAGIAGRCAGILSRLLPRAVGLPKPMWAVPDEVVRRTPISP